MAARRHARTLRDISHLYLSSRGAAQPGVPARAEAFLWIAAAGRSANRAHFTAGAAAAFARQGMFASVCEIAANLPNVGYYFGLEPCDYLAAAIDRRIPVTGTWNGSVRFACSALPIILASCGEADISPTKPHIILGAATVLPGSVSGACRSLEVAAAAFAERHIAPPANPDGIIVVARRSGVALAREIVRELRGRYPETILFVSVATDASPFAGADETIVAPGGLAAASPRRAPPCDPMFEELAASLVQRFSSRRRRDVHAANG